MIDPLASRTQAQFVKMLRDIFGEYLKDNMRTSVPGHVLSFDPDTQLAEVQIGLMLEPRVGDPVPRRQIVRVPVQFWGGSGGTLECRIGEGVEGVIFFSQECIDSWVDQGGVAAISEPRRFSLNDAYFTPASARCPGLSPRRQRRHPPAQRQRLHACLAQGRRQHFAEQRRRFITIGANGTVNINGVTITPESLVTTPNDVVAGEISLKLHRTSGVQSGNQTSGVPIP